MILNSNDMTELIHKAAWNARMKVILDGTTYSQGDEVHAIADAAVTKYMELTLPDPIPSPRRLENRVATLEEELKRFQEGMDAFKRAHNIVVSRVDELSEPTPDQPAAPRIDPDDEEQIQIVANVLGYSDTRLYRHYARRILTNLVAHLNGSSDE